MITVGGFEKLQNIIKIVDKEAVQAFVDGVFEIADRAIFNVSAMQETWTKAKEHDYTDLNPTPNKEPPPYGWVRKEKIRSLQENMIEAIKTENWENGFVFAIQILMMLGVI